MVVDRKAGPGTCLQNPESDVFRKSCAIALSSLLSVIGQPVFAQGHGDAEANNPLARFTALNLQNQYTGELTGIDEDANSVLLRAAKPFDFLGATWIARATLPINTFPTTANGGHTTGFGDLNILVTRLFNVGNPGISLGVGPILTLPTASDEDVGSEKYSAGFANVMFVATSPKHQFGYLLTWQASFAGEDDRRDVEIAAFQPFYFYQFGGGTYLRSTGIATYNFETDAWSIPVGLGIGKVIPAGGGTLNLFVEPQYAVLDDGPNQPEWGVFAGINYQY